MTPFGAGTAVRSGFTAHPVLGAHGPENPVLGRKYKAKVEREQRAETNRRLLGRTSTERAQELVQKQKQQSLIDGARLQKKDDFSGGDDEE